MFKSQLDLGNVQRVRKLSLTLGSVQKLFEFRSLSVCCFLGWSSMLRGSWPKGGAGGPGASFSGESVAKVGSCRLYPPSSHAFLSPLPRIPFVIHRVLTLPASPRIFLDFPLALGPALRSHPSVLVFNVLAGPDIPGMLFQKICATFRIKWVWAVSPHHSAFKSGAAKAHVDTSGQTILIRCFGRLAT